MSTQKWLIGLVLVVLGIVAQTANADFELYGSEHVVVTTNLSDGILWDNSSIDVQTGGQLSTLHSRDNSTADISGGMVYNLYAHDTSSITIRENGIVGDLYGYQSAIFTISGGEARWLRALDTSTTIFIAEDFVLGGNLTVDGDKLLGTGELSGKWLDGTPFQTSILTHEPNAQILLTPEPATISLLALGGLTLLRRRR